jgi:hypothetical protein
MPYESPEGKTPDELRGIAEREEGYAKHFDQQIAADPDRASTWHLRDAAQLRADDARLEAEKKDGDSARSEIIETDDDPGILRMRAKEIDDAHAENEARLAPDLDTEQASVVGDVAVDASVDSPEKGIKEDSTSREGEPDTSVVHEDKAKLTALNDDATHPRGNLELAQIMSEAGQNGHDEAIGQRKDAEHWDSDDHPVMPDGSAMFSRDELHKRAEISRDYAREDDEQADEDEQEVREQYNRGMLPISEAFKRAHPEYSFTPEGVRHLKGVINSLRHGVKHWEGIAERFSNEDWSGKDVKELIQHTIDEIEIGSAERLTQWEDEGGFGPEPPDYTDEDIELQEILKKPALTAEDIKSWHVKRYEKLSKREKAKLEKVQRVLEDIRNGNATSEDYQNDSEKNENDGAKQDELTD